MTRRQQQRTIIAAIVAAIVVATIVVAAVLSRKKKNGTGGSSPAGPCADKPCKVVQGYGVFQDSAFAKGPAGLDDKSGITAVPTGPADCGSRCQKTPGCQGFAFSAKPGGDASQAACYLKKGLPSKYSESVLSSADGWVAGIDTAILSQ